MNQVDREVIESLSEPAKRVFGSLDYRSRQRINNSEYTSYYATSYTKTVKKADCERDSISTKESNVNDYSKYLQGKYFGGNIWGK